MQFSRLAATFVFLLAFGVFAFASPAAMKRQDDASIADVLSTLQTTIAPTLTAINATATDGTASNTTLSPLFDDLTSALDTATTSLAGLAPTRKRQTDDDIASTVADIVTDIVNSVNTVATTLDVDALVPGLDASLSQVLNGLETLLAGVLNLVATLLVDVAQLLRELAFGLTLASLGM